MLAQATRWPPASACDRPRPPPPPATRLGQGRHAGLLRPLPALIVQRGRQRRPTRKARRSGEEPAARLIPGADAGRHGVAQVVPEQARHGQEHNVLLGVVAAGLQEGRQAGADLVVALLRPRAVRARDGRVVHLVHLRRRARRGARRLLACYGRLACSQATRCRSACPGVQALLGPIHACSTEASGGPSRIQRRLPGTSADQNEGCQTLAQEALRFAGCRTRSDMQHMSRKRSSAAHSPPSARGRAPRR